MPATAPSPLPNGDAEATAAEEPLIYELVLSRPLPAIDTTKCIKNVVFNANGIRVFRTFLRLSRGWITTAYWLGVALGTTTLFVPPAIGRWLSVPSMPLQLIPAVTTLLLMRSDLARLLLATYEFWYLTLSNALVSFLIALSFADVRGIVMVGAATAFEVAVLADANYRASRLTSLATILGAVTNIVYITCASFDLIHYGSLTAAPLLRYGRRALYADDVIANFISTLVILLVHAGVRKYQAAAEVARIRAARLSQANVAPVARIGSKRLLVLSPSSALEPFVRTRAIVPTEGTATEPIIKTMQMRCITYHCCIHLRPIRHVDVSVDDDIAAPTPAATIRATTTATTTTTTSEAEPSGLTQLQFVPIDDRFDAEELVLGRLLGRRQRAHGAHVWTRGLNVLGTLSLLSCLPPFLLVDAGGRPTPVGRVLAWTALGGAGLVSVAYLGFAQRRLLRRLHTSFDFVFLSVQLTLWHLCAGDLVYWDARAAAVLASWLWMHWVITLDALTPVSRQWLSYHRTLAIAVVFMFLGLQGLVVLELVFLDSAYGLQDRVVFTLTLNGHAKPLRVVPFLFGRLVTTLAWTIRLLWRLHDRRGSELLMLRGQVQYDYSVVTMKQPGGGPRGMTKATTTTNAAAAAGRSQ